MLECSKNLKKKSESNNFHFYPQKKNAIFFSTHTPESADSYLHDFDYKFRHFCALLTKFSPNFTSCTNHVEQSLFK